MHVGVTGARIKSSAGAVPHSHAAARGNAKAEGYCVSLRDIGANSDEGKSAA